MSSRLPFQVLVGWQHCTPAANRLHAMTPKPAKTGGLFFDRQAAARGRHPLSFRPVSGASKTR
jgi:hypothetical protein